MSAIFKSDVFDFVGEVALTCTHNIQLKSFKAKKNLYTSHIYPLYILWHSPGTQTRLGLQRSGSGHTGLQSCCWVPTGDRHRAYSHRGCLGSGRHRNQVSRHHSVHPGYCLCTSGRLKYFKVYNIHFSCSYASIQ